jgi:hypothetical protein
MDVMCDGALPLYCVSKRAGRCSRTSPRPMGEQMTTYELKIEKFDVDYVPNPNTRSKSGTTAFKSFWKVRGQILLASQLHGATGPEDGHTPTPKYWLVEDQYNDDLYQIMEVYDRESLHRQWIDDLVKVLTKNKGWAVVIGLGDCSILLFADRLLVPSDKFRNCSTVDSVLEAAQKRIKRKKA